MLAHIVDSVALKETFIIIYILNQPAPKILLKTETWIPSNIGQFSSVGTPKDKKLFGIQNILI